MRKSYWIVFLCFGILILFLGSVRLYAESLLPIEDSEIYVIEEPPHDPNFMMHTYIGAVVFIGLLIFLKWLGLPLLFFLGDHSEKKDEEKKGGEVMDDLVVVAIGLLTFAIGFLVRGEISHLRKPKQ